MMDILAVAEVFALHSLPVERLTPGSLQKIQSLRSILENGFGALQIQQLEIALFLPRPDKIPGPLHFPVMLL